MTNEQILAAFKYNFNKKKEIPLINSFKGLPISFNATILAIEGNNVTVKVDRSQIVCMYRDHETYIQGEAFQGSIKGHVTQLDLFKLETILSYFEVPEVSFNDRAHIRVEPNNPISGNIKTKEARIPFRGILADISQGGLGIYIEERLFHPNIYRPGVEIIVEVSLPSLGKVGTRTTVQYEEIGKDERTDPQGSRINPFSDLLRPTTSLSSATYQLNASGNVELHGTVVKTNRDQGSGRYRVGIKLAANDINRSVIHQFVNIRQAEIINEIRAEYLTVISSLQKPK